MTQVNWKAMFVVVAPLLVVAGNGVVHNWHERERNERLAERWRERQALRDERSESEPFQIDVNSAPWPSLTLVDGVGPATAKAIVKPRPFRSWDGVRDVPGVGLVVIGKLIDDPQVVLRIDERECDGDEEGHSNSQQRH